MKKILPYLQISTAMMIVGSNIVVSKLIIETLPVFIATTLRFALASIILLPLVLKVEGRLPLPGKRDLLLILLLSFFGNFLYNIFLLYGLKLASATESGIISGTAPVVTAALSYIFLRERIGWNKVLSIALVILGIIIINLTGSGSYAGMHSLLGALLIGGSVMGEALWTIFGKSVSNKVSPLALASLTTFAGFFMFLPLGISQFIGSHMVTLSPSHWLLVVYYGAVGTVGAYLLWYRGMPKVPASTAGVFVGLTPVSAVVLSFLLLKEPFAWTYLLGMLCVLASLAFITLIPAIASQKMQK